MADSDTFDTLRDGVLLSGERTHEARAADVVRLADLNDKRVPDTLIAFFRNPELPIPVRVAAGHALETFRFRGWIPDLLSILRSNEPREIRETAAFALRLMADAPMVADGLIEVLYDRRQSLALSVAAAAALYHEALFDYPEMTAEALGERILPALVGAARDSRLPVRAAAVNALRMLERTDVMPRAELGEADIAEITDMLMDPEDPFDMSINGCALLGEAARIGNETATAALVALLEDEELNEATRFAAAEEIGYLGTPMAVPTLSRLVDDRLEPVKLRTAAASALSGIRSAEAFNALRSVVLDPTTDTLVRARAAQALVQRQGRTGAWESDLADTLLPLLSDPLPDVRGIAAEGLGDVGGTDALPYLSDLLNDDASADFLPVTWWRVQDAAKDAIRRIQERIPV
jgi:HEAT repeat protein